MNGRDTGEAGLEPRLPGLLLPGTRPDPSKNAIQVSARFSRLARSRLPEFKRLAAEALQIARSEPRVLQYEWFFDDAETLCVVRETYEDAAALLEHMANVSDVFARLIEVGGGCELEVFGDVPGLPDETPRGLRRSVFRSPFQRT